MKTYIYSNRIKLLALFFCLAVLSSCKKLIEIPGSPPNSISSELIFADSVHVMAAVAGIYNNFDITALSPGFHNGGITIYTGLASDELALPAYSYEDIMGFYTNGMLPNNSIVASLWTDAYSAIYHINACLEGISGSTGISASLKQQLIAEIKVDRALYYFNLVNLYGPVPLVTTTDYKITQHLPRASADEIYSQIVKDLTEAQQALKVNYPSEGKARPNLSVASALLARVYLYKGEWKNAENAATRVISDDSYHLNQNLDEVFLHGSSDAIWQLPANGKYSQTTEAANFIPTDDGTTVSTSQVPSYYLSANLLSAFETGDLRKQQWTRLNLVDEDGTAVPYYFPYKYKNIDATADPAEDYMVIRLAEVYLIRAEAYARQGNTSMALQDLKQIRNPSRVGLAEYAGPTDPASLLKAIMHERQTELFCEWGNRWFELKRTGTIDAVLAAEKTGWKATAALFPVPLTELLNNPFLKQNSGY